MQLVLDLLLWGPVRKRLIYLRPTKNLIENINRGQSQKKGETEPS